MNPLALLVAALAVALATIQLAMIWLKVGLVVHQRATSINLIPHCVVLALVLFSLGVVTLL